MADFQSGLSVRTLIIHKLSSAAAATTAAANGPNKGTQAKLMAELTATSDESCIRCVVVLLAVTARRMNKKKVSREE
jgi:hypothetical protein